MWSSLSMLSRSATVARMAAGHPVVGDDAEVDRVGRVPDQDLGPLLRGPAVHRLVLPEAGEPGGLGPDGLVEDAVHPHLDASIRGISAVGEPLPSTARP